MVQFQMDHKHEDIVINSSVCPVCHQHDFRQLQCSIIGCRRIINQNVGDHAHQSPGVQEARRAQER